jgi:hypothetical protein
MELFPGILTVSTAPRMIKPKLKDCCVVLAAFSLVDKSPHATLPSSLKAVTAFLLGLGVVLVVPSLVCVAYNLAAIMGRRAAGKLKIGPVRQRAFMVKRASLIRVLMLTGDVVVWQRKFGSGGESLKPLERISFRADSNSSQIAPLDKFHLASLIKGNKATLST